MGELVTLATGLNRALFDAMDADPTVYHAMNGPTEFHVIGSMKAWTIIDRLARIDVPVLLISGRYDEATPEVVQPFMDHIPDARWVIFEASSHMPHVEERELCMKTVNDFLSRAINENPLTTPARLRR